MKNKHISEITVMLTVLLLTTALTGCGRREANRVDEAVPTPAEAVINTEDEAVGQAEIIVESAAEPETGRQDGERFEEVIILEGMEEKVQYEHVKNKVIGFEMDYDYENFIRHSEAEREWFVSCWDDPGNPENYLEVRSSQLDAETAAAAIGETLSKNYEISRDDAFLLARAGRCIRIDASADVGGQTMPDQLQMVYIVPAADGCRVATAHYAIEGSEGFGRRFRYMMDTFEAIVSRKPLSPTGTWQTASMGYLSDGTMSPEFYVRFTDSDILYGHLKDGQFVPDHTDKIVSLAETDKGGLVIQAEAANGVQYTYRTSESDGNVLEYYETWREEEFPDMYRGGASLSRSS